jgi:hypothetical protein
MPFVEFVSQRNAVDHERSRGAAVVLGVARSGQQGGALLTTSALARWKGTLPMAASEVCTSEHASRDLAGQDQSEG